MFLRRKRSFETPPRTIGDSKERESGSGYIDNETVQDAKRKPSNATGSRRRTQASSNLQPQVEHTLQIFNNLVSSQLALAVETVDESDRALSHLEAHGLGANHHLHLEAVALALSACDDLLKHVLLVQPEATGQVANAWHEHHVCDQIGCTRGEFAEQIPSVNTTLDVSTACVASPGDNVGVGLLLDLDHLRNELGVVAEISVHDYHKVAIAMVQAMNVGGTQTELSLAGLQVDVFGAVESLKLLGDFEGAVRGAIVDNHNFPVQVATKERVKDQLLGRATLGAYFSVKVF